MRSAEPTANRETICSINCRSPEGATIQDESSEDFEPHALPLAALREAVSGWVAFLEEKRRT